MRAESYSRLSTLNSQLLTLDSRLRSTQLRVRKAVITAAGANQRALPLQTLIDDGVEKSVLGILIEQALTGNIGEICVVVWPGDEIRYTQAAGNLAGAVRFVPQEQPQGYGHAIYCARDFVGNEPFLHMVGDHLYVGAAKLSVQRLLELSEGESCSVSGVQPTRESLLPRFGAVAGRRVPGRPGLYRVETVVEKPTPTDAEQRLLVPGIRAGYYLCYYGIHVLTPTVMDLLGHMLANRGERALRFRRRSPNWRGGSSIWRWKIPASATISAPAMAC